MQPIRAEVCEICGESLLATAASEASEMCSGCREHRPAFAKATAFGAYEAELRELIHLLKYERVVPAAALLGRLLAQAVQKLAISDPVLVVPVPLHSAKRRQRGFNQAELIAKSALKQTQSTRLRLASDVLVRTRATGSQIGLTRPQRAENVRGAFHVLHLNKVSGRSILLVDDVLTTGTTASECTRVLLKAGAKTVWVATVARTLKQSTHFEIGSEMPLGASA